MIVNYAETHFCDMGDFTNSLRQIGAPLVVFSGQMTTLHILVDMHLLLFVLNSQYIAIWINHPTPWVYETTG